MSQLVAVGRKGVPATRIQSGFEPESVDRAELAAREAEIHAHALQLASTDASKRTELDAFVTAHAGVSELLVSTVTKVWEHFVNPQVHMELASDGSDRWAHVVLVATVAMEPEPAFAALERFRDDWWSTRAPRTGVPVAFRLDLTPEV